MISTPKAKYCTGDILNMYLESWIKCSEYVRFKVRLIPQAIIEHYNLEKYAVNGYVDEKVNNIVALVLHKSLRNLRMKKHDKVG